MSHRPPTLNKSGRKKAGTSKSRRKTRRLRRYRKLERLRSERDLILSELRAGSISAERLMELRSKMDKLEDDFYRMRAKYKEGFFDDIPQLAALPSFQARKAARLNVYKAEKETRRIRNILGMGNPSLVLPKMSAF